MLASKCTILNHIWLYPTPNRLNIFLYHAIYRLFYPINWRGIPIYRWENQPFGLLGWQGIVPAKRVAMATKLVDVTISKLLTVKEIFSRLRPGNLAPLLAPTVNDAVLGGKTPPFILKFVLRRTARDLLRNIEKVVDVKDIVVNSLTRDPKVMGNFFQKVGAKELQFLIDSGAGFGFLLGLIQMIQWILFPVNWTLPIGGAVVGYITNWIALKWIFEPLYPTKVGIFVIQGMFLRRQQEVSREFSEYIAARVLNSQHVWQGIIDGAKSSEFRKIVARNVPLGSGVTAAIIESLRQQVGKNGLHPVHVYTDAALVLKSTLIERMSRLTHAEFEQVRYNRIYFSVQLHFGCIFRLSLALSCIVTVSYRN
jgi:uncharacterized membrane protein YheB (UPF0754 family)